MTVVDADMTVERIISGGQTGTDSAALGFAVARGIPHGGWGPKGRRTEDGVIPDRYLLREKPGREYRQRTEWNVRDSDATVIFTVSQEVTGGSKLTAECAGNHPKPCLHLAKEGPRDSVARLREYFATHAVRVLNVAGSRASKEPEVGRFVRDVLGEVLGSGGHGAST